MDVDEPGADLPTTDRTADLPERIHRNLLIVLLVVMGVEVAFLVRDGQWINAFLVAVIMAVTLSPPAIGRRLRVHIPPEFQILVILFTFAALFLGEVKQYYERFWWWDIGLHISSGLLLGILGFLLVYVLNEDERVEIHMRPRFVALFAFVFALGVGCLWEIFEFGMDRIVGTSMQKPMFDDPSGLSDTMWDLIVDTLGALTVSLFGWWHMQRPEQSFIEIWIRKFIERNPHMFRLRRHRE